MLRENPVRFRRVMERSFTLLAGSPEKVTLESRIYNFICIIALLVIGYNIPFNYFTGLKPTAYIFVFLFFALACLYYLSRFMNKVRLSIALSVILVNLVFAVNYFFSSGIQGASLLTFTLTFFLVMLISPRGQYVRWLGFNLILVIGIIIYEYYYPDAIKNVYLERKDIFIDLTATYITDIIVIFWGTLYLKLAYTEEKERREEEARVLEVMNTEKNKLFSIISHDLGSPMTSIQMYLQLMRDVELSAEDKLYMEAELLNMVKNTQEMLFNMLSWSKSQMQGLRVDFEPVNIYDAIKPILEINETLLSKKELTLKLDLEETITATADLNMLQLIIRNLVNNAIKFTQVGGHIRIEAKASGDECLLVIRDNGIGIDDDRKGEIFSLKTRSTFGTGNEKGVGLGLYLCKEYTEAQHGKIWFESTVNEGSSFYLLLPLADKDTSAY